MYPEFENDVTGVIPITGKLNRPRLNLMKLQQYHNEVKSYIVTMALSVFILLIVVVIQ
jgi:hypothetical protein